MDISDDEETFNMSDAEDDYYCDDDDDVYGGSDDDDGRLVDDVSDDDDPPSQKQQNFSILTELEIQRLQEEAMSELSLTLSVSMLDSFLILRHYNWNVSRIHDEWFADEGDAVKKSVGLMDTAIDDSGIEKEIFCRICFEMYSVAATSSAACGHRFCRDCWRGYIGTAIKDGPGCLGLRCPDPKCSAAVGCDIVELLVFEEEKEKYKRYLVRSYVEDSKRAKWCPARGCDLAVSFVAGGSPDFDVRCGCGHGFCWNCVEEAHRPLDCQTVAKWVLKNSAESENTTWILANSKPCPKCKKPIEKNHGCMHMTCRAPCRFEFCWLCLGPWSEHGESSGGFYACNRYTEAKKNGELYEEEMKREMAKSSLERYTHYYERWASNKSSMQKALVELQSLRDEKLDLLRAKLSLMGLDVKFVDEAWEQIAECRRVLQWTYAYGYYIPFEEQAKRELFEHMQGEAESGLERLHECSEKDLKKYFDAKTVSAETVQDFAGFRCKLATLTIVTRNHFENLIRAVETGLQEVDNEVSRANKALARERAGPSVDEAEFWSCSACSFAGNPVSEDRCDVCESSRPRQ